MKTAFLALLTASAFLASVAEPAFSDEIELIDGSVIQVAVQEVQQLIVVVVSKPGDLTLHIPRKYLSPMQNYKLNVWRLQKNDLNPADPEVQLEYGRWCLENAIYDERLIEKAKFHMDEARKLNPEMAGRIEQLIALKGFREHPSDPSKGWVSEDDWHKIQGHTWDAELQKWLTKEEKETRDKEREKDMKIRLLPGTKPEEFIFTTPDLIRGCLSDYGEKKVRLWGRIVAIQKTFPAETAARVKFEESKYLKVSITGDDCAAIYFDLRKPDVKKKIEGFNAGERVVIYGQVKAEGMRFAVEGLDIILK